VCPGIDAKAGGRRLRPRDRPRRRLPPLVLFRPSGDPVRRPAPRSTGRSHGSHLGSRQLPGAARLLEARRRLTTLTI